MEKMLLLAAFGSLLALASSQVNEKCQLQATKSDDCLRHAVVVGREVLVLPRNVAEVDSLICDTLPGDIRCINDLRSCLRPVVRTLFNVAIRSINKGIKSQFCGSLRGKKKLVSALKCVQGEDEIKQLGNVVDKISATIDYAATHSPTDVLIPHLCCVYFNFLDGAGKIMDNVCDGNQKLAGVILKLMSTFFEDVIDLGCGKFKNIEYCDADQAEMMARVRQVWANQTERYKTSPITPILTLLDRLDSKVTAN